MRAATTFYSRFACEPFDRDDAYAKSLRDVAVRQVRARKNRVRDSLTKVSEQLGK